MIKSVEDYKNDPNLQALARQLAPTAQSSKPPDICDWAEKNYWVMDEWLGIAMPIRLLPHQKTILRFMFAFTTNWRQMIYSCPKKSGKALALDTVVPTRNGYTTIGAIQVGDEILDEYGSPTEVTFVTDVMYGHQCYELLFSDGTKVVADADHQWVVFCNNRDLVCTTQDMVDGIEAGVMPLVSIICPVTENDLAIVSITPVASVPVRCLQVDNPAHLFLITEAKIPTHNTAVAGLVARYVAEFFTKKGEILCMANDQEQSIGRVYKAARDSIELNLDYDRHSNRLGDQWHVMNHEMVHEPSGTSIKALSKDYKGEAGANPVLTLWTELWGYSCLSSNTLILTKGGWRNYTELTNEDQVATLNENNEFEWQQPEAIHEYDFNGNMLRFQHRRGDMLVTPNHRVLGSYYTHSRYQHKALAQKQKVSTALQTYGGAWHEYAVDAAAYAYGVVKADCDYVGETRETFTLPAYGGYPARDFDAKKWFELVGWYVAEGCYLDNGRNISVSQSSEANPANYLEIVKLVQELGFTTHELRFSGQAVFIKNKQVAAYFKQFGKSADQHIPEWYKNGSKEELSGLFHAYLKGDGWFAGKDGYQCQTTSAQLKDDLLEVGLKCGYIPRYMNLTKLNHPTQQPIYRLSFSNAPIVWQRDHNHWTEEPYNGKVWCVTVPNSTFYVQRNGYCYWTGNSEASRRFWSELTPVPTRKRSFRFIETYAGYTDESDILLDVYTLSVKHGRRLTHEDLAPYGGWPFDDEPPIYVNEPAGTVAYWDDGPIGRRMPWQTPEYYESEAKTLTEEQFNHLHNNWWQNSITQFIDEQWWNRQQIVLPPLDRNEPCVLGADASVTGDCTGLVMVSRHPERRDEIIQRAVYVWKPSPDHPMDYGQTLEPAIREACARYNVVQLAYDPYQLHMLATDLRNEGVVWAKPFNQGVDREKADYQLFTLIRDKRIWHGGNPDMLEHIQNAGKHQATSEDTKLRIVKKPKGGHVDLVVATSMACYECLRLML